MPRLTTSPRRRSLEKSSEPDGFSAALKSRNFRDLPSPSLDRITTATLAAFRPPTTLTVSEWADAERYLSPEASAEVGRYDTSRAEYLRGVMDAITDPTVTRVVVAKASQVGYTEALNNVVGFYIDQDPSPILIVQPTVEMGEAWSKDRLAPMLRDTPCLAGKVSTATSRDSSNTLRMKTFPGGRLAIVGANSPAGLASRPVRIVLADEVDRWPVSAGSEGDPLALASKRQATFWNRRTLIGSTPTLKGTSVIWREFEASDMRKFFVPCPDCDHRQVLQWSGVKWNKSPTGKHLPTTACYTCESCGSAWDDSARQGAVSRGEWRATNSEDGSPGVVGFHVSVLMSPWVALADVVAEFLAARRDPALLQVWTNTSLGEPFEEAREKVESTTLANRGEAYGPQSMPEAVRFLTAGVDVQGDRLEVQVIGWGPFEESWSIRYEVLPGDPAQQHVWSMLDDVLRAPYHREDGQELRVRATCVDTGGHHAHQVLTYCTRRRGVLPIKGTPGPKAIFPPRASRTKTNHRVFLIGVDTAKDTIYARLRFAESGPGFMHFPAAPEFNAEFFRQLTSEEVQTRFQMGRPHRQWILPPGRRNEALDTAVYALAARMATRYRLDMMPKPSAVTRPVPVPMTLRDPDTGKAEMVSPPPTRSPVTTPTTQAPQEAHRQHVRRRVVVRSNYLTRS